MTLPIPLRVKKYPFAYPPGPHGVSLSRDAKKAIRGSINKSLCQFLQSEQGVVWFGSDVSQLEDTKFQVRHEQELHFRVIKVSVKGVLVDLERILGKKLDGSWYEDYGLKIELED